ncbi:hypothetical protein NM208_g415 [Fusarium decemcellulare]|uniref:Uncharacterized protein n=2 Tax=Fusarium decemcellulare TaxID=57161 RepID=A0ACC1SZR8_9HYPO|nr:hypothetical protein NM208_g5127 [Fusarium decemcellulare]KAJ3549618.1 hypothetical protein NM208_g415 [Fusarium decemcellulare]
MLFHFTILVVLTASGRAAAMTNRPSSNYWNGFSKLKTLFVFGDSYSRTGFDPSDEDQPSVLNPLGNPPFPGRTSANGPNWVGYLTASFNESVVLAYNFAASGATLDISIVNNNDYDVIHEIDEGFTPYYKKGETFDADTSLFAIWIGINDIANSYLDQDTDVHGEIFKSFRYRIETLYNSGARNFLLLTVPPLQRAPRITGSSASASRIPLIANATMDWNSRIWTLQKRIQYLHSGASTFVYNSYPLFQKVIEDPLQFEETSVYKNTATYCSAYQSGTEDMDTKLDECEHAANEYLWLNSFHPTSPMHKLLAKEVANYLKTE